MKWILFLNIVVVVTSQDLCPSSKAPNDLAAVSVWVKEDSDLPIYRISDEDLSDYGYKRSPADRDNFIVLLARSAGSCDGLCSIKISTNERSSDKVINHQENALGAPADETDLVDDFYCGRTLGACGADVPIFKFTNTTNGSTYYAYSLDPKASFSGMKRDQLFQCFGWVDGGSVVHPISTEQQCMRLTTIENGKITYSAPGSGAYPVGTTAVLTCDTNYAATGQSTVMCTKDGWNPKDGLGSCVIQKVPLSLSTDKAALSHDSSECAAMPKVDNGQIIYSSLGKDSRFPNRTTLNVLCNLGFLPAGETTSMCENGIWNAKTLATCQSMASAHCLPMITPVNGKIIYTAALNGTAYGEDAMAELQCDSGFTVKGTAKTVCEEHAWGAQLGSCVKPSDIQSEESRSIRRARQTQGGIQCPPLTVLNGVVSYLQSSLTQQYSSGTTATLICNLEYTISGSATTTCQNGAWIPAIGACILSGAAVAPALGAGSFLGLQCGDMLPPLNGAVTYSLNNAGLHPSGATATLTCNLGYTISGALSSLCSNGVWSPPVLGTCTLGALLDSPVGGAGGLECPNPVVFNGQITYASPNLDASKPVGTVATLICNPGTTVSGSSSSTCQNGAWTPAFGVCTGTPTGTVNNLGINSPATGPTCFGLLAPLFGTITYSQNAPFGPFNSGTTATLTCTTGSPSGATSTTCTNGLWSPTALGTCSTALRDDPLNTNSISPSTTTNAQCFGAIAPLGGTITYSSGGPFGPFNQSTTATLTCTSGTLQGSAISTCNNGAWSPALGTCSTNNSGGVGVGAPAVGSCPFPPLIPFGATTVYSNGATAVGPFPSGGSVTVTCPAGQTMNGSPSATCSNGMWSALGTCSINSVAGASSQCLFAIATPVSGTVTYSTGISMAPFNNGTVATLNCNMGSSIQGQSSSTCINGQFTPFLGTCQTGTSNTSPGTTCGMGPTTPLFGTVTYSGGATFPPFNNGVVASLTCMSGYSVSGAQTSTCSGGSFPTLGTCVQGGGNGTQGGSGEQCPFGPPPPMFGMLSYSSNTQFGPFPSGTVVRLDCNSGYTVQGNDSATCTNGSFDRSLGSCVAILASTNLPSMNGPQCTSALLNPSNGIITYSNAVFPPFNSGTTATLSCFAGTISGSSSSTCTNGVFTPTIGNCV